MTHCCFGARRLKRVFAIEIEKCEKCGGNAGGRPREIIFDASNRCIEDTEIVEKILKHLGLDEESQTRNRSPPTELFEHSGQLF